MWPHRSQAAGCAQGFCQCLTAAVSAPVGAVPREKNYSALRKSCRRRWAGWGVLENQRGDQLVESCSTMPGTDASAATTQEMKDSLPFRYQAEGGDLWDRGNRSRFLLKSAGKSPPCLPHFPSCPYTTGMRLWNLMDGQTMKDEGPSRLDRGLRTSQPTVLRKRNRGKLSSLPFLWEGLICWPDPTHREVFPYSYPGTQVRDITRKLTSLMSEWVWWATSSFFLITTSLWSWPLMSGIPGLSGLFLFFWRT